MSERTKAWYEFNRRMRNAYPWPGSQRLRNIDGLLSTEGLIHLATKHRGLGRLLVGEPGESRPYAECKCFSDGSGFILVSGGLLDFVQAVHTVIVAGARLALPNGGSVDPKLAPDEVDDELLAVYDYWKSLKGTDTRIETWPDFDQRAQDYFEKRYLATRVFILMHEKGHAALHAAIKPHDLRPEHELEADAFALDTMLKFVRPGVDRATLIAGSTLMPRLYKALEIMGHTFAETHPPPAARVAALLDRVRMVASTEFDYYILTGHARVQDLRMAAVEHKFAGGGEAVRRFTGEDIVFSVISGVRSLADDSPTRSFDEARANLLSYLAAADSAALLTVSELWKRVKSSASSSSYSDSHTYIRRCLDIADKLIFSLPETDRALFNVH